MLKTLYIKNFALVDQLKVDFNTGLNIITGETGTGKSIIIGALGIILGEKFKIDTLRHGADKSVLEAEFEIENAPELFEYLNEQDVDSDGNYIIIRRELNESGRSRSFVNDTPVSMPILEHVGNLLVDLHGQHQHQLLLQSFRHISYLDEFANISEKVDEYKTIYTGYLELKKQLDDIVTREKEIKQASQMYEFQLNEINTVDPQPEELDEAVKEERILKNSEKLYDITHALFRQLYEEKGSVTEILSSAKIKLDSLIPIDESFGNLKEECENASIIIQELANSLSDYNSKIQFDPDRLETLRQRISVLNGLLKKYGGTIDAVLEHKAHLQNELNRIDNLDEEIAHIRKQADTALTQLKNKGLELSKIRKEFAKKLSDSVTNELASLGMSKSRFDVSVRYNDSGNDNNISIDGKDVKVSQKGLDRVEFLISANPGEALKPLTMVASGGEISRIMLALKSLLAKADHVPVLIFDEIDIGISGRIAQAVGKSMKKLAHSHQILCITHLPQIASLGDYHYLVEKNQDDHSTQTSIRILEKSERVEHIARLIGGDTLSDAHLQSAAELLNESESSKTKIL